MHMTILKVFEGCCMHCRDTSKHQRGKRARDADEPELSDVSNDENDPAVANQAVSTRQQRRKKDHPSDGADLTEADLAVVKEVIQGMLQIRGWTGSATVSALQARVAQAGHAFNEAQLVQVSHALQSRPCQCCVLTLTKKFEALRP